MKNGVYNSYKSSINNVGIYVTGGLLFATLCSGIIADSMRVSAEDPVSSTASANASVTVAEACTFAFNNVTPHTTTLTNNNTAENVGSTTFTATCNDPSGLAIYAVGYSNDEFGNTNLIGSTGNIATGTDDSSSNWSLKLNNLDGYTAPDFLQSSYTAVPATYAKVASRNSNTTNSTTFGVNATYRFHISATQPADTYTGKVKYTIVHPASEIPPQPQITQPGCINYYPNGTRVEGTMGCQTIPTNATSATLLASNYSRKGYGFAGWNTEYDYSGTFYGPNETISFTAGQYTDSNPGLSLYAVWVKSEGSLQDSSKIAELCGTSTGSLTQAPIDGTANLSSVSALTDQRDNDTYAIAKLADGNCWMIENLRLDNTNIDNSTGALAQGYSTSATYGNFSGLADPESPWTTSSSYTTANSLYSTDGVDDTINIGTSNASYRFPRYNNQNIASRADTITTNNNNVYSYGNYYTWAAAIADTTRYASVDHGTTSICPSGWRLPIGNQSTANKSFGALSVALGGPEDGTTANSSSTPTGIVMSNVFRSYPNNFLYSGYVANGSVVNRGSGVIHWSSTSSGYYDTYGLNLSLTVVNPGTYNGISKYTGNTIRCIASS